MENEKLLAYESRKIDKTRIWLLFLFLGWSYGSLGKTSKQIFYYLTLGGVGVWTIYRLFTLNKAIRKHNLGVAQSVGLTEKQINLLNLYA